MKIKQVEKITDIKKGDTLLIANAAGEIQLEKAQAVKVSEQDGTEVITHKGKNRFFNLGMYLEGKSWVKDLKIIKP